MVKAPHYQHRGPVPSLVRELGPCAVAKTWQPTMKKKKASVLPLPGTWAGPLVGDFAC